MQSRWWRTWSWSSQNMRWPMIDKSKITLFSQHLTILLFYSLSISSQYITSLFSQVRTSTSITDTEQFTIFVYMWRVLDIHEPTQYWLGSLIHQSLRRVKVNVCVHIVQQSRKQSIGQRDSKCIWTDITYVCFSVLLFWQSLISEFSTLLNDLLLACNHRRKEPKKKNYPFHVNF